MTAYRIARRLAAFIGAALVAASLAACGDANATFDKNMHDSCVTTATGEGVTAAQAETYCACMVVQLDKVPLQQRVSLNQSSPQLTDAAAMCRAQAGGATAPANDMTAPPSNTGP
jgi:hypothetical protein